MDLTNEQNKAVNEIDNNLQIIACAGSGKTEVITRRIANILINKKDVKSENLVAFTFTEKAAESMKKRILNNLKDVENFDISGLDRMYIGTIHGYCYNILKRYCKKFEEFKILDTVKNYLFVERYYKQCGMLDLELENTPFNIKLFLSCIDKMISDYENFNQWDERDRIVFEKYKNCLYSKKYFDFSLLIHETILQLEENKNILKNIKYLIIDEYQDVDDLQEMIIKNFYENKTNICVVGDDDQTIYRFRGSNASNMINFSKRYSNVVQVRLEKNFRCAKSIVDVADSVIENNVNRLEKKMISNKENDFEVTANNYLEQYDVIAEEILGLKNKGIKYNDIAILVRKGKFIKDISSALDNYNIPYYTDSAEYFFNGTYFTKFVNTLNLLNNFDKKQLFDYWKDCSNVEKFNEGFKFFRRIINGNGFGIENKLSNILTKYLEIIEFLDNNATDIQLRKDSLKGITDILDDYDEIYADCQLSYRISGLLNFLEVEATEQYKYKNFKDKDSFEEAVQIMTVHKAKGLEFDTVFIPNLMQGEFPPNPINGKKYWHVLGENFKEKKDMYESDIEDERKLFYVAVTRAKERLYLMYNLEKKKISQFVVEAAESEYLDVDRDDFEINQKEEKVLKRKTNYKRKSNDDYKSDYDYWKIYENNRQREYEARKEYYETVKRAKKALLDYYGTAMHFMWAAGGDFNRVLNMEPEELLEEARRLRLI